MSFHYAFVEFISSSLWRGFGSDYIWHHSGETLRQSFYHIFQYTLTDTSYGIHKDTIRSSFSTDNLSRPGQFGDEIEGQISLPRLRCESLWFFGTRITPS